MFPMTPYLALVFACYGAFMLALAVVWARGAIAGLRARKH